MANAAIGRGVLGMPLRRRRQLPHDVPAWVTADATYFVTICSLPRGQNRLCHADLATALWDSVGHRQQLGQWWLHLFLLMPDHVHALLVVSPDTTLVGVLAAWKRYTARHLGLRWQRDFFEHRLRNDESLAEKADYIVANPVRAGLVDDSAHWPYVWPRPG